MLNIPSPPSDAGADWPELLTSGGVSPRPASTKTIVIVGAGFSGAVTAVNLLRLACSTDLRVVLINRSPGMARGVAYGTRSAEHVLNVPAGNMSALADDPDDFLRYCRWSDASIGASSFVSRQLYGTYLEALLAAAEQACGERPMLQRKVGAVVDISVDSACGQARVTTDDGESIDAEHVVLAFGNFVPADPAVSTPDFYSSDRYCRDPWSAGALSRSAEADDPVLLLGTGLTAIDVALALHNRHDAVRIVCLSRHGLVPASHRPSRGSEAYTGTEGLLDEMGTTCRAFVAAVRRHTAGHIAAGGDWRDVVAALRPHTTALWQRLPMDERARFLRHVQSYWDVSRHRCAPQPYDRFNALVAEGVVSVVAAHVLEYQRDEHGVTVTLRRRGAPRPEQLRVSRVVNCTGPNSDLRRSPDTLVRRLLAEGTIAVDPLGLGIDVDDYYRVRDSTGRPSTQIRYVGPLLKARDWEATAVPELRVHAFALARQLLLPGR